jgi:hypothetical protein
MSNTGCFEGRFKIQGKQKSKKKEKNHKPIEFVMQVQHLPFLYCHVAILNAV